MSETATSNPVSPDAEGQLFDLDTLLPFVAAPADQLHTQDGQAGTEVGPDAPVAHVYAGEHKALERSVILVGLTCAMVAIIASAALFLPIDRTSIARLDALRNTVQMK